MGFQQHRMAESDAYAAVPTDVALIASRYQSEREIEALQLGVMSSHNLAIEWTEEAQAAVLEARIHVRAACETRARFRRQIRDFVCSRRAAHETLPSILRQTRSMIQLLQSSGAIRDDGGWMEAEVLEWAIEEYEIAD